jgi:diguanylate cyclase (GGDEF)-like protein
VPIGPRELLDKLLGLPELPAGLRSQAEAARALADTNRALAPEAVRLFHVAVELGYYRKLDEWSEKEIRFARYEQVRGGQDRLTIPLPPQPAAPIRKLVLPLAAAHTLASEEHVRSLLQMYREFISRDGLPVTRTHEILAFFCRAVARATGADQVTLFVDRELSDPLLLEVDVPETPPSNPEVLRHVEIALAERCLVVVPDLTPAVARDRREDWRSVAILPLRLALKAEGNGLVVTVLAWSISRHFWNDERLRVLGMFAEIGPELIRQSRSLHELAFADSSGANSRKYFEHELPRELARAAREQRRVALCIADMDDLKKFNSRYGLPGGDKAIRHVCLTLRERALRRASDWVARLGGDEFAFILVSDVTLEKAEELAQKVCDILKETGCRELPGSPVVSITIGGALFPDDGQDYASLLRCGSEALKWGKEHAKSRATFYARFRPPQPPDAAPPFDPARGPSNL